MSNKPSPDSTKLRKVNVVVGGRFHAPQIYRALKTGHYDVRIYSSSPKRFFRDIDPSEIVFIPKPTQFAKKLLGRAMPRLVANLEAVAFDYLVAAIMRPADILYGFNGDSLICGRATQARGGLYVLDRACPHFLTQERMLAREAEALGYPYSRHSNLMRRRFVSEYTTADAIVVPSLYSAHSFAEHGVPAKRVHVAPLDANAPAPVQRDGHFNELWPRRSAQEFRIGIVGGSFLRKGLIYLLRAVKLLSLPEARLFIRANRSDLAAHAEALALSDELSVEFVPYLDDINDFYRSVDVFVLSSIDEGFGMVAYEALVNGTPLVASSNVGAAEGLADGDEALIVPAGDAGAIAKALTLLHSDPERRRTIGKAGRAFYLNRVWGRGRYDNRVLEIIDAAFNEKQK